MTNASHKRSEVSKNFVSLKGNPVYNFDIPERELSM